jgi:hypothetical protein
MKFYHYFTIIFCLLSCDFIDDKLSIQNNTAYKLIVNVKYFKNRQDNVGKFCSSMEVNEEEKKIIGLLNRRWENLTKNSTNESFIKVILIPEKIIDSLNQIYYKKNILLNKYDLLDSLYNKKEYDYKEYSLKELEHQKWQIIYPDDGFKRAEQ